MEDKYIFQIMKVLNEKYNIVVKTAFIANRGFFAKTYKIETETNKYFLKIDYWPYHKKRYLKSLDGVNLLLDNNISFIPKIFKTKDNKLYFAFKDGIGALFECLGGEHYVDYPVNSVFEKLLKVYNLNFENLDIEKENFNADILIELNELLNLEKFSLNVKNLLKENKQLIDECCNKLKFFSDICKTDLSNFHITHGDVDENCIVKDDELYIVDWDSISIAPIERDAWVYIYDNNKIDAINNVLLQNNFEYKLNMDRLCYYCYHYFLFYVAQYLRCIKVLEDNEKILEIENILKDYLSNSRVFSNLKVADIYYNQIKK